MTQKIDILGRGVSVMFQMIFYWGFLVILEFLLLEFKAIYLQVYHLTGIKKNEAFLGGLYAF